MNHIYPIFLAVLILSTLFFASCDQCDWENSRSQAGFNLEIRDGNTKEHLFFGANPTYSQNEFGLFIKNNDSLVAYHRTIFEDENCFSFYTNDTFSANLTFDKLTDTFYVKIPNYPLDTLTIEYNRETTECFGEVVSSYDIRQNGILICESCTLKHRVIIFKD
jgi:hypothetical protein